MLPVRNGLPFLAPAVESVLAQDFAGFELIVVDDGSTDGTGEYLRRLAARDRRVRVIRPPVAGLASALNAGLAVASGEYLARQDADDQSAPDRLARQVAMLDRDPTLDVVATCADYIDEWDQPVDSEWTRAVRAQQDPAQSPQAIEELMPLTCCVTHGSVMLRTAVLRRAGGYDPATVPAEDYDLWLRLLPDHRFRKLPDRLYAYRVHGAQSGALRRADQTTQVIEAKLRFLRRQVPGLPRRVVLALPCRDLGAALFRQLGPRYGFVPDPDPEVNVAAGLDGLSTTVTPHVVAVTSFGAIGEHASKLLPRGYQQFGNLFVCGASQTQQRLA